MSEKFVLCIGDIVEGFSFCGPFSSYDEAEQYYESLNSDAAFYVAILNEPIRARSKKIPLQSRYDIPDLSDLMLREQSPLNAYGYHVGHSSSLTDHQRRALLLNFWRAEYAPDVSPDVRQEWGAPASAVRLERMIRHLTGLASLNSKKAQAPKLAIVHWREDADFLSRL